MVDLCVCAEENGGGWVTVLSSVGHLYVHMLQHGTTGDLPPTGDGSNSFFLTNTVNLPQMASAV